MKRTCLLILASLISISVFAHHSEEETIRRGAAVSEKPAIAVKSLLASAADHTKTPAVVAGTIVSSCTRKGCWLELGDVKQKESIRVTFKDYGFFIPLTAKGMKARAEGVVVMKTLTKEEASHLESEGAKLTRNDDGTATEISFVASGIELEQP